MKSFLKERLKWIVPVAFIAVVLLILGIENLGRQQMHIDINSEEVEYIICYSRGLGPRRLDYLENKAHLDKFFEMISGKYSFVRSWSNRGRDSGGLATIYLCNREGDLIDTVLYADGFVCVSTRINGIYYLYRQEDKEVCFDDFEEMLNLYGKSR